MTATALATAYAGPQEPSSREAQDFKFLEFLARIKDGDAALASLHQMANGEGDPSDEVFYAIGINIRTNLYPFLDNHRRLVPPYREIAQRCLHKEGEKYSLTFGDERDQTLIRKYHKGEKSASTSTEPAQRPR